MLGEQFRNVNIVPQVITVMRVEAQTPWAWEKRQPGHAGRKLKQLWRAADEIESFCKHRLGKQKNSALPAEIICACMREKKGKKIFSQKLIRVQLFLWWWNRSDTSACTAWLGLRLSSLPSAFHHVQSTEHIGMWWLIWVQPQWVRFSKATLC